jgi:hypothetical protein
MAVTYQDGNVTITCDKCGHSQTAKEGEHNDAFMHEGWAVYSNARKWKNHCMFRVDIRSSKNDTN